MFNSKRFEIVVYQFPEFEDLTVKNGLVATFFTLLAPASFLLGNLLIILSWFKVLKSVTKFYPTAFGRRERVLTYSLIITLIIYTFFLILSASLRSLIISPIAALTTLAIFVLYVYSTYAFNEKLAKIFEDDEDTRSSITSSIQGSVRLTTILMVLVFVFLFIYTSLQYFQYELLKIGRFNYIAFFRDIVFILALTQAIYMGHFFYNMTLKQKKHVMQKIGHRISK